MRYIKILLAFIFLGLIFIFLFMYTLFSSDGADSCKMFINHQDLFLKNQSNYIDAVDYYLTCGESCDIKFTGKGCGEGKQCYRKIADEVFNEKIRSSQIRSIKI